MGSMLMLNGYKYDYCTVLSNIKTGEVSAVHRVHQEYSILYFLKYTLLLFPGHDDCPSYPTELVIALDMSEDVSTEVFERMRSTVRHLLEDISVAESNCPRGARVALVSFSSSVKYLIRFSDHHHKQGLLTEVNNIALERTANSRDIGAAMRFVARHVFKRTRQAFLLRKVAIFITNGPSHDAKAINTAVLELKAHDIHTAVISFRNVPHVLSAFQVSKQKFFYMNNIII